MGGKKAGRRYKIARQVGLYTTIPAVLLVGPVFGYFAGKYIDDWAGTEPWFMVLFVFIGMGASVKELLNLVKTAEMTDSELNGTKNKNSKGLSGHLEKKD